MPRHRAVSCPLTGHALQLGLTDTALQGVGRPSEVKLDDLVVGCLGLHHGWGLSKPKAVSDSFPASRNSLSPPVSSRGP
jgi:hypothetical protein